MGRPLKTKFPCRECRKPAEVKRLSWAPFAICPSCAARRQHINGINYKDEQAAELARKAKNAGIPKTQRLELWLRTAATQLAAAARCIDAIPDVHPNETLHMWRCGKGRLEGAPTAEELGPLLAAARKEIVAARGVNVVDGEGLPPEHPAGAPPTLRVVRDGDEQ